MNFAPVLAAVPSSGFTWIDWAVLVGYLAFTTWLGARLSGKPATVREFFLGGRKLSWWAVAGSTIATEISAVTFVGVPAIVYGAGGNFTYLQLALVASLFARVIVAWVFVPAYFEREIYSPYDYMGARLGGGVRNVTTALFTLGGILGQAARVYLTAIVLELILGAPLAQLAAATGISALTWSIWLIGLVAVVWTLLGGITTVIWTDVVLFGVFLIGAIVALVTVVWHVDGGAAEIVRLGSEAGKFKILDFDPDPTKEFTVWTAAIAVTWFNTGVFGTDQLMAQRMFCCRDVRAARLSVIASFGGAIVPLLMLCVGAGLFAYYHQHPLSPESGRIVAENGNRIFPVFILDVIPTGLSGLIIAGIFAAAISSLESILAALAQTTMTTLVLPLRERRRGGAGAAVDAAEERRRVGIGRWLVVGYGVVLSVVAHSMITIQRAGGDRFKAILNLALSLATYASGGLLASFLMAFLPVKRDGFGLWFSAPLSVLCVIAFAWKQEWVLDALAICGGALFIALLVVMRRRGEDAGAIARKGTILAIGIALAFATWAWVGVRRGDALVPFAWPWQAPYGTIVAFGFGFLLGNRREEASR